MSLYLSIAASSILGACLGHVARRTVPAVLGLRDRSLPFSAPWLEVALALLFAATAWLVGWSFGAWPYLVVLLLATIAACDYLVKLIPDVLTFSATGLAFAWNLLDPSLILALPMHRWAATSLVPEVVGSPLQGLALSLSGALVGLTALEVIRRSFGLLAGLEVMGFGDSKLALLLGAVLGPAGVLMALPAGFCLGVVHGVAVLRLTGQPHSPFGPPLALGAWLVMMLGESLIDWAIAVQRRVLSLPLELLAAGYSILFAIAIGLILRTRRKAREYEKMIEDDYRRIEEQLDP